MNKPKNFIGPVFPRFYHRKQGFQGDYITMVVHQVLFHPTSTSKKGKKYPSSSIATQRAIRDGRHYQVWNDKAARKKAKAKLSVKWKGGDNRRHAIWSEDQRKQKSEFMKELWRRGVLKRKSYT